jgi:O-antigen ligase
MHAADTVATTAAIAWWIWPIALFFATFALGIVAVLSGVGGGVLFVPIVASFFPFHLDFVRGAGLLIALAGALSAAPATAIERAGEPAPRHAVRAGGLAHLHRRRADRPRAAAAAVQAALGVAIARHPFVMCARGAPSSR